MRRFALGTAALVVGFMLFVAAAHAATPGRERGATSQVRIEGFDPLVPTLRKSERGAGPRPGATTPRPCTVLAGDTAGTPARLPFQTGLRPETPRRRSAATVWALRVPA